VILAEFYITFFEEKKLSLAEYLYFFFTTIFIHHPEELQQSTKKS